MDKKTMKEYESPSTKKAQVELEDSICAGSEVSIKDPDKKNNVEVDEYISIENDVTFD